jgi:hypothetical protein
MQEEQRESGDKDEAAASGGRKEGDAREKRNGGEGWTDFPKDLCVNIENYKGLSVKQNFPLI